MKKFNISFFIVLFFICFLFSLEIPVPKYVHSIACSDINLDNNVDIIIGSHNNDNDTISVIMNDNGYFTKTCLPFENYYVLKSCDINGDNYPDLITALTNWNYCYYLNDGYGNIESENTIFHQSLVNYYETIKIADMDNDGDNDVVFRLHHQNSYWGICTNNGYGQFYENVYYNTNSVLTNLSIGKINNDELEDILIARSFGAQLFYNYFPTFEEVILDSFPATHSYIDDMDNNENNDLVLFAHNYILGIPCYMKILYNCGDDTFAEGDTLNFPCGTLIQNINDFNNDGFPDLVYTQSTWDENNENIFVCFNNQDGTFNEPDSIYIGTPQWFKISSADFDNNSYQDIVVTGYYCNEIDQGVRILFNDGTGIFFDEPQVGIDEECIVKNEKCKLTNFPNPFNPTTNISFQISEKCKISLSIYNIKGQLVSKLIDNETFQKGSHSVIWNGKDNKGKEVSSNVYLYTLRVGNKVVTKKMLLVR